jgi:hypothetical protein
MPSIQRGIVLGLMLSMGACSSPPRPSVTELAFLTRGGCSTTATMRTRLDTALGTMGLPSTYQVIDLETLPDSDARRGYPTPTVLYASRDLFGMPEPAAPYPEPT